jgi:hypothetical protein
LLAFTSDEVEVIDDEAKHTCVVCEARRAMWLAHLKSTEPSDDGIFVAATDRVTMCGWCIMYSEACKWGHEERDEILHVGRAAQEHAMKHYKPLPAIDERGRLMPEDADRFMLGVAFTSKMLKKMGRIAQMSGEG